VSQPVVVDLQRPALAIRPADDVVEAPQLDAPAEAVTAGLEGG
jgi:hypothetical protein